jgi:hypothetical protein
MKSLPSHLCYISHPFNFIDFIILILLGEYCVMLVSLVGNFLQQCYFLPFKYKYSLQHTAPKHPNTQTPQPVFFPFGRRDDFKDKLRQSEGFEAYLNVTPKQLNLNVKIYIFYISLRLSQRCCRIVRFSGVNLRHLVIGSRLFWINTLYRRLTSECETIGSCRNIENVLFSNATLSQNRYLELVSWKKQHAGFSATLYVSVLNV